MGNSDEMFDEDLLANLIDDEEEYLGVEKEEKSEADQTENDSADEILQALMKKENSFSPAPQRKSKKKKRFVEVENKIETDDDTEAKIAALQAQIELLKKKSPKNKSTSKEKCISMCPHGKIFKECFFCTQTKEKGSTSLNSNSSFNAESKNPKPSSFTFIEEPKKVIEKVNSQLEQKRPRVAHRPKMSAQTQGEESCRKNRENCTEKKRVPVKNNQSSPLKASENQKGSNTSFCGIQISQPKIPSVVMEERMKNKRLVKCSKIQSVMVNGDIEGDWVTVGVVVHKIASKKTNNGKNFSVWKLSDLQMGTENDTIGLFLFGEVYKAHWKTQVGRVVALLNPSIMKKDKDQTGISISLDNPKKLMELGSAKDLGVCKGIRKSDGQRCSMFLNKKYGDYCEYHVQAAFKKAKSGRMDLQSGGLGPDRRNSGQRFSSIKKDIHDGVYHYEGSTLTLSRGGKKESKVKIVDNKMKGVGLSSVFNQEMRENAAKNVLATKQGQCFEGGSKELNELLSAPTMGSRNLIHHLGNLEKETEKDAFGKPITPSSNVKDFLRTNKTYLCQQQHVAKKRKLSNINFFESRASKFPQLGRGLSRSKEIEFSDEEDALDYDKHIGEETKHSPLRLPEPSETLVNEISIKSCMLRPSSKDNDKAKLKALSLIRSSGAIKSTNPNQSVVGRGKTLDSLQKIQAKVDGAASEATSSINSTKKSSLAGVLGHIDLNSKEYKKLLCQKSRNIGAIQHVDNIRQQKYFEGLEKKERMEEKYTNTFEIKVTCYACRQCGYMAESESRLCKEEKHAVARLAKIVKRFFKCVKCGNRATSYNRPLPKNPCSKCGEMNFEKVAMGTERTGPKIGSETLEVRGREEKFIGS